MPDDASAPELKALNAVFNALKPLQQEAQNRVIKAVRTLLGSAASDDESASAQEPSKGSQTGAGPPASDSKHLKTPNISDIRTLKEEKRPATATQMTAVVAYYLAEIVAEDERKREIDADDITTLFKQAGFRLPASARQTLINTKNAGYIDAAGEGRYKLNPVGHNLVVHGLPRDSPSSLSRPSKPRRKKARAKPAYSKRNKKAAKKKRRAAR